MRYQVRSRNTGCTRTWNRLRLLRHPSETPADGRTLIRSHLLSGSLAVVTTVGALVAPFDPRGAWQHLLLRLTVAAEPMRDLVLSLHTPPPSIAIVCSCCNSPTRST